MASTVANGPWTLQADLPPTALAPATARILLERLLVAWGQPQLAEEAGLVVSELVTNAVVHADHGTLRLEVRGDPHTGCRVAVTDASAAPATPGMATDEQNGRGLHLLPLLTTRWGVDTDHTDGARQIWVELT